MNNNVEEPIRGIINLFYATKGYVEGGVKQTDPFEQDKVAKSQEAPDSSRNVSNKIEENGREM